MKNKINQYIDEHKDDLFHAIQELVQIKSHVGEEMAAQKFMKKKYKEIGLDIHEFEPDYEEISTHEAFIDSGVPFDGRKNLIGIYEGQGKGRSLTLHGHVDVVPAGEKELWSVDPWSGKIIDNKLYGRGSADMKSGLLANWFALKTLVELKYPIQGEVQLHSVIEEESGGGGGALACLEKGFLTDGYITSEPHNLNITISHAGVLYFRVKVKGRTAHAGLAHEGVNAISKMYPIFNALEDLNKWRAENIRFKLFESGSGQAVHLNLGSIRGGEWVSTVPGEAVLECRIGFIPGETRKEIMELIEKTVTKASENDEWMRENPPEVEWFGWSADPWYQDPEHTLVKSFQQTTSKVLERDLPIIGRAAANDARFTQYYNRSGIAFGPIGENMHGPNECVDLNSVLDVAKVYANFIINWTEQEKE